MTTAQDKNGAKVDLGLLEEDDEFEEFPADGEVIYHLLLFRIKRA